MPVEVPHSSLYQPGFEPTLQVRGNGAHNLMSSFEIRTRPAADDPGEDTGETVGGATEMAGAATFMGIGEGAPEPTEPTEKVQLTELGGVTPTAKTRMPPVEPHRPVAEARMPATMPRTAPAANALADDLDAPTRLASAQRDSHDRITAVGMPPLPAEPAVPAARQPKTAQNTVPRAAFDSSPTREREERSRAHLDDTKPRALVSPSKKTLGVYRVTGVLASGQMGVVYRGEPPGARKGAVAIKSIQSELTSNAAAVARFFAESMVLARIDHPNVVRFHDFGYDAQGSAFLVMELLEGETLTSRLARERQLEPSVATGIALQIAQGLSAAHKLGIIHRDVKPDNVFLCDDGTVKLIDFGLAKLEGQGPTHTLAGGLLGTAAYMAPEQGRSASDSDARSDVYSVGCVLFQMVCGVVPYPGSLIETLVAHQTAERPPARALNHDVSAELDAIIDKMLQRDPAARIQSAAEVVTALGVLKSTRERPSRGKKHRVTARGPDGNRFVTGSKLIAMRSRWSYVVDRVVNEPLVFGLLCVVIVLVTLLIVRW